MSYIPNPLCPCAQPIGDPLVYAPPPDRCATEAYRLGKQTQAINCMTVEPPAGCAAALANDQLSYWYLNSSPDTDAISGRVLTNGGDVTVVAGKIGNALNFPGTANSFMTCPDDAALRLSGVNFTVRLWVFINAFHATKTQTILKKLDWFAGGGWSLRAESLAVDSAGSVTFYQTSSGGSLGTPVLIPTGQWVHVVFVHGVDVNRIYANTVSPGIDSNQGPDPGTADLYLGQDDQFTEDASFTRFVGKIDEVGIWSFAWTQGDVTCDYNTGAGRTHPFS